MSKVITVPMSYKVILKNGDFGVFRNDNDYDNFEDRLISGIYGVSTSYRDTTITPDNVLRIETFIDPNGCEHCGYGYNLHVGENACPECGERTFLPATETSPSSS